MYDGAAVATAADVAAESSTAAGHVRHRAYAGQPCQGQQH
ncbi:hypothetical protein [Desulfovibrio sp. JC022]